MQELVDELIEQLKSIRPHLPALSEAEEAAAVAKAELESTNTKLGEVKKQLADSSAAFTAAQLEVQKKHEEMIYAKQQELKALSDRIKEAESHADELDSQIRSKQSLHSQLEGSIESLRKKFG
jgi:chromosome segregation ATPase